MSRAHSLLKSSAVPLVAVLSALAMLVPLAITDHPPAEAAARVTGIPAPLLWSRAFADPTVVESRVGYVGAATAPNLNIGRSQADAGPWNVIGTPALTRRPGWASSAELWAPDIQRAPGGWLMYYAAPIAGADENSRCIGVAVSKAAYGPYTPIGNAPLVCPVVPGVPRAADAPPTRVRGKISATRGVIDPSAFTGNNGQRFLVYRTQGQPSSIRLVKLSQRGRRIQQGQTSMLLTSYTGIEENPVITQHDGKWVMFTSVGWFGHCGYRTVWRRSPDFRDWSRAVPKLLLSTKNSLCGPVAPTCSSGATARRSSTSTRGHASAGRTRARPTGTRTGLMGNGACAPSSAPTWVGLPRAGRGSTAGSPASCRRLRRRHPRPTPDATPDPDAHDHADTDRDRYADRDGLADGDRDGESYRDGDRDPDALISAGTTSSRARGSSPWWRRRCTPRWV